MDAFSITWRQPGWRIRMVIIIIIYLAAFRLAPHQVIPLSVGATLGGLLTAEPTRSQQHSITAEGPR